MQIRPDATHQAPPHAGVPPTLLTRRTARQACEKMAEDLLKARTAHGISAFVPKQGHLFTWSKGHLLASLAPQQLVQSTASVPSRAQAAPPVPGAQLRSLLWPPDLASGRAEDEFCS